MQVRGCVEKGPIWVNPSAPKTPIPRGTLETGVMTPCHGMETRALTQQNTPLLSVTLWLPQVVGGMQPLCWGATNWKLVVTVASRSWSVWQGQGPGLVQALFTWLREADGLH